MDLFFFLSLLLSEVLATGVPKDSSNFTGNATSASFSMHLSQGVCGQVAVGSLWLTSHLSLHRPESLFHLLCRRQKCNRCIFHHHISTFLRGGGNNGPLECLLPSSCEMHKGPPREMMLQTYFYSIWRGVPKYFQNPCLCGSKDGIIILGSLF